MTWMSLNSHAISGQKSTDQSTNIQKIKLYRLNLNRKPNVHWSEILNPIQQAHRAIYNDFNLLLRLIFDIYQETTLEELKPDPNCFIWECWNFTFNKVISCTRVLCFCAFWSVIPSTHNAYSCERKKLFKNKIKLIAHVCILKRQQSKNKTKITFVSKIKMAISKRKCVLSVCNAC